MKKSVKLFLYIAIAVILLLSASYALLFTPLGNNLVRPIIQNKLANIVPGLTIPSFRLSLNKVKLLIDIDKNSIITLGGSINIFKRSVNLKYNVNIKNLSKLSKMTKIKLRGSFKTTGNLSGDMDNLFVNGVSNIFDSTMKYKVLLSKFKLKIANISIKDARIDKILYLTNNPSYIKGLINININIQTKGGNLSGLITSKTYKAKFDRKVIDKNQDIKMNRDYSLAMQTNSIVKNGVIFSKIRFTSGLLSFKANKNRFNLKNKTMKTDYSVNIPDLKKLKFITGQNLRGRLVVSGNILKTDKLLSGTSKLPFGNLNFVLKNSILNANLLKINVSKLLYTLGYYRIFRSGGDVNLIYNLSKKSGKFNGNFINGRIYADNLSRLIKQFTRFDITKELYKTALINGTILKNRITANLDMKSVNTAINSKDTIVDFDRSQINSRLQFRIKKTRFFAHIYGNIRKPKINIDASQFIKSIGKKHLNKIIKSKKLRNLINKFF